MMELVKDLVYKGSIRVKETGWGIGPFEKVKKTETTVSSSMIGYSESNNSVKYKFAFVSVSWEEK
jgi:hypothetical protein